MKVLQFKHEQEFNEWIDDNELFQCYDKDMNLLGEILGPDADLLVSFGLAEINMSFRFCQITKELTEKQLEELNKSRLVKTVIKDELFVLTPEQRVIIRRLRMDFEDAKKAGLIAFSTDDDNKMLFFNGNAFDYLSTADNLSGEWEKDEQGGQKFVKYSEEYLSQFIELSLDCDCHSIDGDRQIDFVSYGFGGLPMYAHIKDV